MSPSGPDSAPRLAIVVIVYNMQREAPRTLYSLSGAFQRDVGPGDYEVIVVENGSSEPLEPDQVAAFGPNFRYLRVADASPSPAAAINLGAAQSAAPLLGIMIDGARIASPGVVSLALEALERFDRAVVGTIGFHLGPDIQTRSPRHGYDREQEDALLEAIDWRRNGYRLFEIGALSGSSPLGWLGLCAESNLLFVPRSLFDELGGFDERFDLPGGGLVNLDFYRRACDLEATTLISLLGEGTFHQIHGGVMTNQPVPKVRDEMRRYRQQYREIRGRDFKPSPRVPRLLGQIRGPMVRGLRKTCDLYLRSQHAVPARPAAAAGAPERSRLTDRQVAQLTHPEAAGLKVETEPGGDEDLLAALQFNLLTSLGLRRQHHLLDFGCGSPAAARLFVSHLEAGHFWGIERQSELAAALGSETVRRRRVNLIAAEGFDLDVFKTSFDFVLVHALFGHAGPGQIRRALESARSALKPGGLLVATFVEHDQDRSADRWTYPAYQLLRWQTLAGMGTPFGLHCRKIDWPHPLQTWFVTSSDPDRLDESLNRAGIALLPDSAVLTAWRLGERRAGRAPGYFGGRSNQPAAGESSSSNSRFR